MSKTALAVNEVLWAVSGYNPVLDTFTPVPARVIVVLDQPMKVASTWLPEIKRWRTLKPEQLHKDGKPYYSRITFENGSEIMFLFHETEPMVFESLQLDWAVWDEPSPRFIWIALLRGGRIKGRKARFLMVGTPIGGGAWLREEIVEPWVNGELPDVEVFKYGTKENEKNLSEGYIENFSRYLTEKERRIRLEGEFSDLDGLALAHLFSRKTHLIKADEFRWPPQWPVVVAIDPALAKKHVAVMLGVTDQDQLVVLKELALKGTGHQFAEALKEWMQGYKVTDIVCDSLGSSELTGGSGMLSFIACLKDAGVRARATTYDEKQDDAWINMIQDVLIVPTEPDNMGNRHPRLRILDNCRGLINDIETVSWEKVKQEELYKPKLDIKKRDHIAALKYALAAQPRFDQGRERIIRGKSRAGLRNTDRTFKQR